MPEQKHIYDTSAFESFIRSRKTRLGFEDDSDESSTGMATNKLYDNIRARNELMKKDRFKRVLENTVINHTRRVKLGQDYQGLSKVEKLINEQSRRLKVQHRSFESPRESDLHFLITNFKWDEVIAHCQTHPEEAQLINERRGITPLHLVCSIGSAPSTVVRSVLLSWLYAATMKNKKYWETPLHLACRNSQKTVSKVKILTEICPESSSELNIYGQSPLHVACLSNSCLQVLQELVAVDPSMVLLRDNNGNTPLCLVWNSYRENIFGRMMLASFENSNNDPIDDSIARANRPFGRFCQKMIFLTQIAAKQLSVAASSEIHHDSENFEHNSFNSDDHLLQAIIQVPFSPLDFFVLILRLYPASSRNADKNGNLPLHLVAASWRFSDKFVFDKLISLHPRGAHTLNKKGELPLHIALKEGKSWYDGVQYLVHATPRLALGTRDIESGLLPFMMAAVGNGDGKLEQWRLDTVFLLLLKGPEFLTW